jgi:uncharacterized protein
MTTESIYLTVLRANSPQTGEYLSMVERTIERAINHFRTGGGSEVDVVLEQHDGSVAGGEVKGSATVTASDFVALQALRDQLGKQFRTGLVLYLGDRIIPFGEKLWLVPVPALWAP